MDDLLLRTRQFWDRMPDLTDKDTERKAAMKKLLDEFAELLRELERLP